MSAPRRHRGRQAAAVALLALLAACGPSDLGSRAKAPPPLLAAEYPLDDYGLSLRLPAGWQVSARPGALRWQAVPIENGQPVPGVYFLIARDTAQSVPGLPPTPPAGLGSFVDHSEALARKDSRRYRIAATGTVALDGRKAIWHERAYATYTTARRSYSVMTVRGDHGYLLSGSAPEGQYRRWEPAFRAIAGSLRWREPVDAAAVEPSFDPD